MPFEWLPLDLFESAIGFTTIWSLFVAFIGGITGSLTIAFVAGYSMFAFLAINADIQLLNDVFIATLVLMVVGFSFKVWRTEGVGGGT